AWRNFLLLIGRTPEAVRAEGGIARLWIATAGRHVELREIDYSEVLRERVGGHPATWDKVVANCLQGDSSSAIDEETLDALLQIAGKPDQVRDLVSAIEAKAGSGGRGVGAKAAALLRMMRGIIEAVSRNQPDQLDPALNNVAAAVGQLSPDVLLALL